MQYMVKMYKVSIPYTIDTPQSCHTAGRNVVDNVV